VTFFWKAISQFVKDKVPKQLCFHNISRHFGVAFGISNKIGSAISLKIERS
jgi:hypothetical protein